MIEYRNECVGCTSVGLPCIGVVCSKRRVPYSICDRCGAEEETCEIFGEDLCKECARKEIGEPREEICEHTVKGWCSLGEGPCDGTYDEQCDCSLHTPLPDKQ